MTASYEELGKSWKKLEKVGKSGNNWEKLRTYLLNRI